MKINVLSIMAIIFISITHSFCMQKPVPQIVEPLESYNKIILFYNNTDSEHVLTLSKKVARVPESLGGYQKEKLVPAETWLGRVGFKSPAYRRVYSNYTLSPHTSTALLDYKLQVQSEYPREEIEIDGKNITTEIEKAIRDPFKNLAGKRYFYQVSLNPHQKEPLIEVIEMTETPQELISRLGPQKIIAGERT